MVGENLSGQQQVFVRICPEPVIGASMRLDNAKLKDSVRTPQQRDRSLSPELLERDAGNSTRSYGDHIGRYSGYSWGASGAKAPGAAISWFADEADSCGRRKTLSPVEKLLKKSVVDPKI